MSIHYEELWRTGQYGRLKEKLGREQTAERNGIAALDSGKGVEYELFWRMVNEKIWFEEAGEDYLYWQLQDKKTLKRINALLKDTERNPFEGIVKPVNNTAITDYCEKLTGIKQNDVDRGKKCNNAFHDIREMCKRYSIEYIFTFGNADKDGIRVSAKWIRKKGEK